MRRLTSSARSRLAHLVSPQVTRTRLYNAPAGRYASGVDAAWQVIASGEGPFAFYKGALTHYLRLGPHMILVFGILEQLKMMLGRRSAG